jgi:peptidoglycan/LPS O-acetylase OafA/YrhL
MTTLVSNGESLPDGPAADPAAVMAAGVATDPSSAATLASENSSVPKHDLPVLEAYRGVAAVMVALTHVGFVAGTGLAGPWAGWLSRLDFGVALFFLLSGFLLFRPYVQAAYGHRPAVRTGSYLRRRYVRIYPAFLVVLFFDYLLTPEARQASGSLWLGTLFLVQNYSTNFAQQLPGLVQSWSLVVEISFYLVLPLLAPAILGRATRAAQRAARVSEIRAQAQAEASQATPDLARRLALARRQQSLLGRIYHARPWRAEAANLRPGIALVLMVIVAVAWRTYYQVESAGLSSRMLWLPGFLDWFGAGMALAWLRERPDGVPPLLRHIANVPGACWSLAVAGFWLVTTALGGPYGLEGPSTSEALFKHLIYVAIAVLLLLPAVFGDPSAAWRRIACNPFFSWLGRISFGVFLWHPMLMMTSRRILGLTDLDGGFWITTIFTLVASAIVGTLSWRLVEEPLQRRWRNGFRSKRGYSAVPAPTTT